MGTNAITINVGADCIPITINGLDFSFDTKEENLVRFFDIENYIANQIDELGINSKELEGLSDEDTYTHIIEHKKNELAIYFEIVLGEGSFDKLYALDLGVAKLEELVMDLSDQIAEQLKRKHKNQMKKEETLRKKYLKKKKK